MSRPMRPTAVRRALGQHLRQLRLDTPREDGGDPGLTVEEAAERSGISQSKITKIEQAQTIAKVPDVDKLIDVYGEQAQAERERLHEFARAGQRKEWWEGRQGTRLPPKLDVYFGLEAAATRVEDYNPSVVHGLLQTPRYAYAVVRGIYPDAFEHRVRELVEARIRRQELLQGSEPLELWSIMDEAVVRRWMGGPEVMREQVEHLVQIASDQPNVTLQVLPISTGAHTGLPGQLSLLRFEAGSRPVGYVDCQAGNLINDKEDELERYQAVLDRIRGAALSPEDSIAFLEEIIEELKLWTISLLFPPKMNLPRLHG